MKNSEHWKPSKFEYRGGRLRGTKNRDELSLSSVLIADLIAKQYDKQLAQHVKGKLLDLGCGKVPLYLSYKDFIDGNVCVDWENSMHQNPYVDIFMDLNQPLLFPDQEFDTIILSDVLEHISNPELLWQEMFRILKPGGKLILNVPFLYPIHEQPYDFFRYTQFALERMAEKAGFKIVLLEKIGGLPEVLTDLLAKGIKHLPLVGPFLSLLSQKITFAFVSTRFGQKVSKKTSANFPLGYFLIAAKE
jgi:2-polyprenyl-3-methyl-5-hydroxy-6-metoxy-1,4-benzoquinol methylase